MTDRVILLDVGHGNCTVIHDGQAVTIVDAANAGIVLAHVRGEPSIKALLVSHGDADHLAGAGAVLTSHQVVGLYVNPDPQRRTRVWEEFLTAIKIARHEKGTIVHNSLSATDPGAIDGPSIRLEVVAPTPEIAIRGAGGRGQSGNTVSAVVRVVRDGVGRVLLAADMDGVTLDGMLAEPVVPDLRAEVLVFPHHGGLPGSANAFEFAQRLCAIVQPARIVFSIGRHHFPPNPLPDIIAGARLGAPDAHVSCTQLSRRCMSHPVEPAHGDRCAGTIEMHFDEGSRLFPLVDEHLAFVRDHAQTPLCLPDWRPTRNG